MGTAWGVPSSRKLARKTHEDVAFRVMAGDEHPALATSTTSGECTWRRSPASSSRCCTSATSRAGETGRVALDGTKLKANASKHKAMSYERMKKDEKRLREKVESARQGRRGRRRRGRRYGKGIAPEDLPAELQRRETRLQRIREAKAALEEEARAARAQRLRENAAGLEVDALNVQLPPRQRKTAVTLAKQSAAQADLLDGGRKDDDDDPPAGSATGLPTHRVKAHVDGTPKSKAQRNFTDPDSRIMEKNGSFLQAYNAQVVVDEAHQVILAHGLSNQPPDVEYLEPLLRAAVANCGAAPERASADSGYFSAENVAACESLGISAYISVGRDAHDGRVTNPRTTPAKEAMRLKLESDEGRAVYARRKAIVEPVFGQMKAARGFRRVSMRGRQKAAGEWSLVCLTHNLLKLFREAWLPALMPA